LFVWDRDKPTNIKQKQTILPNKKSTKKIKEW